LDVKFLSVYFVLSDEQAPDYRESLPWLEDVAQLRARSAMIESELGLSSDAIAQIGIEGTYMRKGWNLSLGFLNVFAFGAFYCMRSFWTLAAVCMTSVTYLVFLKFMSADD
jgi:hypothetical protein